MFFDPNDVILQAVLRAVAQNRQQEGIPESLQRGAYQPAQTPVQQFQQFQQTPRYQGLSPLEQSLTNSANYRNIAQDYENTLQQSAVYNQQQNDLDVARIKAKNELDKVVIPKQLELDAARIRAFTDLKIREMTETGLNTRGQAANYADVDGKYLTALKDLQAKKAEFGSMPAQTDEQGNPLPNPYDVEIARLTAAYRATRTPPMTIGEAVKAKVTQYISEGKSTDYINDQLMADIANGADDPQKTAALEEGLRHLNEFRPKYLPTRTSRSAPEKAQAGATAGAAKPMAQQPQKPQATKSATSTAMGGFSDFANFLKQRLSQNYQARDQTMGGANQQLEALLESLLNEYLNSVNK